MSTAYAASPLYLMNKLRSLVAHSRWCESIKVSTAQRSPAFLCVCVSACLSFLESFQVSGQGSRTKPTSRQQDRMRYRLRGRKPSSTPPSHTWGLHDCEVVRFYCSQHPHLTLWNFTMETQEVKLTAKNSSKIQPQNPSGLNALRRPP